LDLHTVVAVSNKILSKLCLAGPKNFALQDSNVPPVHHLSKVLRAIGPAHEIKLERGVKL